MSGDVGASPVPFSDARRRAWLRLWRSENIGPRTFQTLLKRFGSAEAALEALPDLAGRSGRAIKIASADSIDRELEAAARLGARFIAMAEPEYPQLLQAIDTPPALIAVRGHVDLLNRPAVAIVGARNASAAGLAFAERLARGLGQAGYIVVSGFARGIDSRAHRAALASGTIAVLAGGHDKLYPADQGPFLDKLLDDGAAVSEMPFGWEARGRDFPRRNRIVSGLSLGVVVIEAARRSGSLITARFAADQGREVFAVPGSPLDPRAEGTNDLLRDGATFCCEVDDVLRALAGRASPKRPQGDLFSDPAARDDEPLWDELDLSALEPAAGSGLAPAAGKKPAGKNARNAKETPSAVYGNGEESERGGMEEDNRRPLDRVVEMLGPTPISIDELSRAAELTIRDVR
ncbi:MAG: DNA-processing protein DprA, partial [Beijerinckiaceae bacterium]|nr:DNA-processing protein DprA [Beijerinckiaceae bacterium]